MSISFKIFNTFSKSSQDQLNTLNNTESFQTYAFSEQSNFIIVGHYGEIGKFVTGQKLLVVLLTKDSNNSVIQNMNIGITSYDGTEFKSTQKSNQTISFDANNNTMNIETNNGPKALTHKGNTGIEFLKQIFL